MKDGKKLLSELAALSPVTVHVRAHNLLTTGDGEAALKWGSTNAYTEDADRQARLRLDHRRPHLRHLRRAQDEAAGRDRLHAGGAVGEAAAVPSQWDPAQAVCRTSTPAGRILRRTTAKWARAGLPVGAALRRKIWQGRSRDLVLGGMERAEHRLLARHARGVSQALRLRCRRPEARAPGGSHRRADHPPGRAAKAARNSCAIFSSTWCAARTTPPARPARRIDYIGFHAKGRPTSGGRSRADGQSSSSCATSIEGFEIVASFPELKKLPIIIGESDPEGCAACSVRFHPQNAYRNGTMYSSYTAATFARKHDLAARHGVNFEGAVTWAFEFERPALLRRLPRPGDQRHR